MDLQDAASWTIPEGEVKNLHDKDNRLLWSAVGYDVKYKGDTTQQTYSGKNLFNGIYEPGLINGNTGVDMPNDNFIRSKDFIPVSENTVYALSVEGYDASDSYYWYEYKSDYTYNLTNNKVNQTGIFNINPGTAYVRFRLGLNFTDTSAKTQIEKGSPATSYEPYVGGMPSPNPDYPQGVNVVTGEQTVAVTGKNLFNIQPQVVAHVSGMTNTFNTDGSMTTTGKPTTDYALMTNNIVLDDTLEDGETYVISQDEYVGNIYIQIQIVNKSTSVATYLSATTEAKSFTVNKAINSYRIRVQTGTRTNWGDAVRTYRLTYQLEKASATTVEPYQGGTFTVDLGSTELCKIGNSQDYIYKSGDDWYVHKETGKALFKGTEDWYTSTIRDNVMYYYSNSNLPVSGGAYNIVPSYSNYFTPDSYADALSQGSTADNCFFFHDSNHYVAFKYNAMSSLTDWTTWLSNHHTTVYYQLNTPTDTQITDSTLISQLDAIHNWLTRYDYYGVVSGNLPIIIDRTGII